MSGPGKGFAGFRYGFLTLKGSSVSVRRSFDWRVWFWFRFERFVDQYSVDPYIQMGARRAKYRIFLFVIVR